MTQPVDIRPGDLVIVRDILRDVLPHDARVWVFGSRATWTTKDSSDLDMAIDAGRAITRKEKAALNDAFDESDLPYKVDFVDMHAVSDSFKAIIERDKVPLPKAESPISTLGKVATLLSGGTPSKANPDYWGGSIPWLTPKDMNDFHGLTQDAVTASAIGNGTKVAPAGAIFLAVRGMSLHTEIRVIRSPNPIAFNQDIKAIIPKDIDSDFLYFALTAHKPTLLELVESAGHGTGVLPTDRLIHLPIVRFSPAEECAIGKIFRALEDKIELNRRMNETLEAMARAIFKDWFVDFGPTRAKMEGRAPYLAPEIWALFPERLDEEEKPEGWEFARLSDCSSLNPESWSRNNMPNEIDYLDLASVKWGVIESTQHMHWKDAPSRAQRILRAGDTVVGTVRPGNGSYSFIGSDGLTGSTGFAALRPKTPLYREFVYFAATSPENIEHLAHLADGAAYPAVRPDVVGATDVCRSSDVVLSTFSGFSAPILDRVEANKRENRILTATRDLLLPKLMSGEIRVKDAEKIAEAAA